MSEKVKGNVQDSPNANLLAQPLNAAGKILTVAEKSNIATKAPTNQGSVNAADLNGNDEIKVEVVQGENVQTSDDSSGSSSSSSKKALRGLIPNNVAGLVKNNIYVPGHPHPFGAWSPALCTAVLNAVLNGPILKSHKIIPNHLIAESVVRFSDPQSARVFLFNTMMVALHLYNHLLIRTGRANGDPDGIDKNGYIISKFRSNFPKNIINIKQTWNVFITRDLLAGNSLQSFYFNLDSVNAFLNPQSHAAAPIIYFQYKKILDLCMKNFINLDNPTGPLTNAYNEEPDSQKSGDGDEDDDGHSGLTPPPAKRARLSKSGSGDNNVNGNDNVAKKLGAKKLKLKKKKKLKNKDAIATNGSSRAKDKLKKKKALKADVPMFSTRHKLGVNPISLNADGTALGSNRYSEAVGIKSGIIPSSLNISYGIGNPSDSAKKHRSSKHKSGRGKSGSLSGKHINPLLARVDKSKSKLNGSNNKQSNKSSRGRNLRIPKIGSDGLSVQDKRRKKHGKGKGAKGIKIGKRDKVKSPRVPYGKSMVPPGKIPIGSLDSGSDLNDNSNGNGNDNGNSNGRSDSNQSGLSPPAQSLNGNGNQSDSGAGSSMSISDSSHGSSDDSNGNSNGHGNGKSRKHETYWFRRWIEQREKEDKLKKKKYNNKSSKSNKKESGGKRRKVKSGNKNKNESSSNGDLLLSNGKSVADLGNNKLKHNKSKHHKSKHGKSNHGSSKHGKSKHGKSNHGSRGNGKGSKSKRNGKSRRTRTDETDELARDMDKDDTRRKKKYSSRSKVCSILLCCLFVCTVGLLVCHAYIGAYMLLASCCVVCLQPFNLIGRNGHRVLNGI